MIHIKIVSYLRTHLKSKVMRLTDTTRQGRVKADGVVKTRISAFTLKKMQSAPRRTRG